MAPKGDGIVEWTDELESAFVDIMVDKFQRTHTSSWKMKDWEQISRELEDKFPGVILGADKVKTKAQRMKTQYTQFIELIQHTGVGWDGPTNTVKANSDIWDKFIKRHSNFRTFRSKGCKHYEALQLIRGKEPIDIAEGFGDSDDPTDEAEEPVITGSRRRVRKRGSNNKSQLQELIDLYKESKVKKDKAKNSTPLESKKSKSVTSPEKPA
ncbi:uncharacterized protein At2g29880-like [Punica granatum]|uniref:Uncharacterized protein At2g29880-like n=1 Tax=Punica granatum TaxID=22663 RepID=A0A6P8E7X7_PUNGR|nr:uncharacterized protein At2g29880-like [Punica granatum]